MSTVQKLAARRTLRRRIQQSVPSAAPRRFTPRFETLEPRRLLTVAPVTPDAELLSPYAVSDQAASWQSMNAAPVTWEGIETYARRGEWIVQFEDVEGTVADQVKQIQQRLDDADFSDRGMRSPYDYGLKVTDHLGADGLVLVSASDERPGFHELHEPLMALGGVEYVEPNFVDVQAASTIPDDSYFRRLYGLHNTGQTGGTLDADIDAPEAWDISTGSQDVVVAVIDTGIDYNHPDLQANIWENPGEIAGNRVDDDGNGYVDDVHGYDFRNRDGSPWDDNSHGTHVAGTIGAVGDNVEGVTGVNWNVQMMALKFLGHNGRGYISHAVQAVNYATMMRRDYGVNVVLTSNSWGGGGYSTALRSAIEASGNQDMLFIAAAGNSNRDTDRSPAYPASYDLDNIISVAATDEDDRRAWFSNYGATSVDLAAPGVWTHSTVPGGRYGYKSGTSMAAPHVAGAAALAWSVAPQASYADVRDAMFESVDPTSSMAGRSVTGGRLNAFGTLQRLGLRVEESSPADGETVTAPLTEFAISFSLALDATSVNPGDLTVNGIPADAARLSDANTVVFSYDASPMASQGLQAMAIAAGAVTASNLSLKAWTAEFHYDALPMKVVSTSPAVGSTALMPLHRIEIQLNEPYAPASVAATDLEITHGKVVDYRQIDEDSIAFLVEDATEETSLTMTLQAGAIADVYGNPMAAFEGTFDLDVGTMAFPTPFERTEPLGSIVAAPERRGVVGAAGDEDTFTIPVDPGQKLTVVVSTDENLQAAVTVSPPDDSDAEPVSAVAGGAGETLLLQDVPTRARLIGNGPDPATYAITVSGAAATTGSYSLQVVLNAAVETEAHGGSNNGSAATAQSLASAMLPIAHAVDDEDEDIHPYRGIVLGRLDGGGDATVPSHVENREGGSQNAFPFHIGRLGRSSMRYQQIYTAAEFAESGVIDELRFRRNGSAAPFDPSELDVQINLSYAATGVGTISKTFADNIGSDFTTVFDGLMAIESSGSGSPQPFDIVLDVEDRFEYDPSRGDLLVEIRMRNGAWTRFFDASGWYQQRVTDRAFAFDVDAERGIANAATPYGLVTQFGFAQDEDWYSFTRSPGESATVALTALGSGDATLDLFSSDGTLVARGVPDPTNVDHVIANFAADDTAGTYYVRVSGSLGTDYSLLVTRNADVEQGTGNEIALAHEVVGSQAAGRRWMLGHGGNLRQRLFAVPRDGSNAILEIDPTTGEEISRIPAPEPPSGLADGLAFNGESLFFMNSWQSAPVLWQLDPDTGAVLDSDTIATGSQDFDGLAAMGGHVYLNDPVRDDILVFDPLSDTVTGTLDVDGFDSTVDLIGGLAAMTGPGALIALDRFGERVLTIAPDAGEVVSSFAVGGDRIYGAAVIGEKIYLGRYRGNTADIYSRDGEFQRTVDLPVSVSGLAGGTVAAAGDFYEVAVDEKRTLMLETHTPGDGSGNLVSNFDPMIRIYNSTGEIVAADDDSSPDGRNATLNYSVPHGAGGTYYVEVLASRSTAEPTTGEYVLSVKYTNDEMPPFEATVVAPPDGLHTRNVPTQVTIDYNDNLLLTTVDPGDLSLGGIGATDVTAVDGNTLAFDLPAPAFHWASDAGGNDHYYLLPSQLMTWQQAEQYAASLGGHLVSINDDREQQFVEHYFLSGDRKRTAYWIGLSDQKAEGTFRWTSGEPLTYTNWNSGEPNDWGPGEDYVAMNWQFANGFGTTPATWNDVSGSGRRPAVIELPGLPDGAWPVDDGVLSFETTAGAIADVQNTPLDAFRSQLELDLTAPRVAATSPPPGGVLAPGDVDVVVTFSEPMDTGTANLSATVLRGLIRNGTYMPETVQWNAAGTALTLSYASLPDDRYTLTLPSGADGLHDLVGWELDGEGSALPSGDGFQGGDFQLIFAVDPSGAVEYPTPLEAKAPLGSLIYDPSITGTVAFAGDLDEYTLDVDPGQTLTVVARPAGEVQPSLKILDPSGSVLGMNVAGEPGNAAVVQVPAADGGTYTMQVGGTGELIGLYTLQTVLNADVEREWYGTENNRIATAQSLESSFIPLLKGTERGAVLGSGDGGATGLGPDGFGYVAMTTPFEFEDISTTGNAISTFYPYWWTSLDDGHARLSDRQLGDFQFDFYGETQSSLYVSSNGLITFDYGNRWGYNRDLRYTPSQPTIAALWDDLDLRYGGGNVYWQVRGTGDHQQLIIQWDDVRFSPSWWNQNPITFQAVLSEADNSIQLNYLDLDAGSWRDEGRSATVGIKDAGYQRFASDDRLLVSYNDASSPYVGTGKSVRIAVPNPSADYYSVELDAGDKITVAATALDAGAVKVELVDGSATTLATGTSVETNVDATIANFEAPGAGTYYVRVTGDEEADYSLVVTRNAVFDTEGNSSVASAQDFAGLNVALGHVGGPATSAGQVRVAVHANDGDWYSRIYAQRLANQLSDSSAFDFTAAPATNDQLDSVAELAAYDVVVLGSKYYARFPMDVAQSLRQWVESGKGGLVATAQTYRQLSYYSTNSVRRELDPVIPLDLSYRYPAFARSPVTVTDSEHPVTTGIDGIPGYFYGASSYRGADANARVLGTEGSYARRPAITVSEASGGRTVHLAPWYSRYWNLRRSGSPGDRLLEQAVAWAKAPGVDEADIYSFTATAGETLDLFTITPADGPGEFVNTLDPRLTLYDGDGNVVATGLSKPDGRNEQILYAIPEGAEGIYRIAVSAENGTAGEYILDPVSVSETDSSADLASGSGLLPFGDPSSRAATLPPAVNRWTGASLRTGSDATADAASDGWVHREDKVEAALAALIHADVQQPGFVATKNSERPHLLEGQETVEPTRGRIDKEGAGANNELIDRLLTDREFLEHLRLT